MPENLEDVLRKVRLELGMLNGCIAASSIDQPRDWWIVDVQSTLIDLDALLVAMPKPKESPCQH